MNGGWTGAELEVPTECRKTATGYRQDIVFIDEDNDIIFLRLAHNRRCDLSDCRKGVGLPAGMEGP